MAGGACPLLLRGAEREVLPARAGRHRRRRSRPDPHVSRDGGAGQSVDADHPAFPPTPLCSHSSVLCWVSSNQQIRAVVTRYVRPFHTPAIRQTLSFPDRWLVQYDAGPSPSSSVPGGSLKYAQGTCRMVSLPRPGLFRQAPSARRPAAQAEAWGPPLPHLHSGTEEAPTQRVRGHGLCNTSVVVSCRVVGCSR